MLKEGESCYYVRFFDKESYAWEFVNGIIRLGKLDIYRNIESESGRGDKNEGIRQIVHTSEIDCTMTLKRSDLDEPIVLNRDSGLVGISFADRDVLSSYIYCLSIFPVVSAQDLTKKIAYAMCSLRKDGFLFAGRAKLTMYAVEIVELLDILKKIEKAMEGDDWSIQAKQVEYLDYDKSHLELDPAFCKDKKFEQQSEYRIQLKLPNIKEDFHFICVGSLKTEVSGVYEITIHFEDLGQNDKDGRPQVRIEPEIKNLIDI